MINAIKESHRRYYWELEENNPEFAAAAAEVRKITEIETYRHFAYSMLNAHKVPYSMRNVCRGQTITPEHVQWVLSNFAEQIERENVEFDVDPNSGWSVQRARKLLPLPDYALRDDVVRDFYFPVNRMMSPNLLSHETLGPKYCKVWAQTFGANYSMAGNSEYVTKLSFFGDLSNTSNPAKLASNLRDFEEHVPEFLERAISAPAPKAIISFIRGIKDFDWSVDLETRRHRSTSFEATAETGHGIVVRAHAGDLWAALESGKIKLTVLPPEESNTASE